MVDGIGSVLGERYRLTALIGTGASASVYVADDRKLGRRVAVKVLHPALVDDVAFLHRFREEARSAARLNHPGVMAVYDTDENDAGPYLVLEFLGGGSLRALLDSGHRLSVSQAAALGLEVAEALQRAHAQGIVHRDIKPANLLFGTDGRLRVADFGLARALSESGFTDHGDRLVGTARYAAPEQARGLRVDGKADVYALALVLVECVTGAVPLVGEGPVETLMARQGRPVPVPAELGPLVPLLERMGRADPAERPGAAEVVELLEALLPELPRKQPLPLVGTTPAAPGGDDDLTLLPMGDHTGFLPTVEAGPPPRRHRRRRWLLAALSALIVLSVGGAAAVWARSRPPTFDVPGVQGDTFTDAMAALDGAMTQAKDVKWQIARRDEFSRTVGRDAVITQHPPPGTALRDGGVVTLVVSGGQPPVDVPPVAGKSVEDASAVLREARLVPGAVLPQPDESVPAGTVLSWRVGEAKEQTPVPEQSVVDLFVSGGPAPRTVPAVAGKSEADAKAAIEALQLATAHDEAFSDTVPKGMVVGTSPAAGSSARRGAAVTIIVSKGPDLVAVPNVVGMNASEAEQALDKAGLVGNASGALGGKVFATDPVAGTLVRRGATITVALKR